MELLISSQFAIDYKETQDPSLQEKLKSVFAAIKSANTIAELPKFRKVTGTAKAYKMGVGFYFVLGSITKENEITLIRFLHRDRVIAVTNQNK